MKRVGVMLSGCGVLDGSEIHEAVLTLLALDRHGVEAICMAPDVDQAVVVDHLTSRPVAGQRRNVLVESARIARGKIRDAAAVKEAELDALILPGGYGAARNLSTFADAGVDCRAHPEVMRLVRELHKARKPLGFICIAPAVAAAVFRGTPVHPLLTIGNDASTAEALTKMGAHHEPHGVREIAVDPIQKIVSTPAYMLADRIGHVAAGIEKLVGKVLELAA